MVFKQIDNTPVANLFNDIAPMSLGKSGNIINPKPRCGCKEAFEQLSDQDPIATPTTIVDNGNNGFDTLNVSPEQYASAFDEIGYTANIVEEEPEYKIKYPTKRVEEENISAKGMSSYITNVYVGSLSLIGLFALYRLVHKTR